MGNSDLDLYLKFYGDVQKAVFHEVMLPGDFQDLVVYKVYIRVSDQMLSEKRRHERLAIKKIIRNEVNK
jgi:hypothetical protein